MKTRKQTLNLPLDTMAERYRGNPTTFNRDRYQDVALEYWADDMIGDQSLLAVLKEIRGF